MSDQMREEFEAWAVKKANASQYMHMGHLLDRSDERYSTTWVDCAWLGWKASRESLVIEMPAIRAEDYCPLSNVAYREECRAAIEAQGLKVKP